MTAPTAPAPAEPTASQVRAASVRAPGSDDAQRATLVPATTVPAVAGVVIGLALGVLGLLMSRADLVVVGLPLLAASVWARAHRPDPETRSVAAVDVGRPAEAGWPYRLDVRVPAESDAVHLRVRVLGGRRHDVVVTPATARDLHGTAPLLHSGPQEVVVLAHRALGADALWVGAPSAELVAARVQAPALVAVEQLVLPHRLQGLTGAHGSARPGDGGEFRDVHPFAPGDRLRRIDWKTTARRAQLPGELYVRRTSATADATVVLVADSRDDVGSNVATWPTGDPWESGTTSLDLTRQAASSLAVAYSRAGDRVGYQDLVTVARLVAPGGGSRHLERLLGVVAATRATGVRASRRRAPLLAPGALVYLFSTFLDDAPVRLAAQWRAAGHRVVAVDVLPSAVTGGLDLRGRLGHELLLLEREDRMVAMTANGVEVLRWAQERPGERAAALRALARPVRRGAR